MSGARPDLTLIVVGSSSLAVSETLESLMAQAADAVDVVRCCAPELRHVLDGVSTEWSSILPQGTQLDPNWLHHASELMTRPGLGAFGGRTLEMRGAQTLAAWFDAPARITSIGIFGECHSLLEALPSAPMTTTSMFLRWDNMVCRTEILREALDVPDDIVVARHATRPCAIAVGRRLEVLFVSNMRCTRQLHYGSRSLSDPPGLTEWCRRANQEVFELAGLPGSTLAMRAVTASILVGTRHLPGLLLGAAYIWWPQRRRRWRAVMRGKLSGMVRVIQSRAK